MKTAIGDGSLCVTKVTFWMLMSAVIISVLFVAAFRNPRMIPKGLQNAIEAIVDFVREGIVLEVIGREGLPFVPFLTSIFVFIWLNNLYGIWITDHRRMAIPFLAVPVAVSTAMRQGGFHYRTTCSRGAHDLSCTRRSSSCRLHRPLTLCPSAPTHPAPTTIFFVATYTCSSPFDPGRGTVVHPRDAHHRVRGPGGVLQAYIFTILTAVYVAGAIHPEH
jgi:F-type H+-transporting ATPase subunit a